MMHNDKQIFYFRIMHDHGLCVCVCGCAAIKNKLNDMQFLYQFSCMSEPKLSQKIKNFLHFYSRVYRRTLRK